MNRTELQSDFYKRYGVSKNRLVFSKAGLLCTLLGHSEIENSEFMSCTLSMCVKTAGRMLASNAVNLENTQTGICSVIQTADIASHNKHLYDIVQKFGHIRPFGAEILYDSSIPEFLPHNIALRISVLNTLLKIADTEMPPAQKVQLCAHSHNPAPYIAVMNSRHGWCSSVRGLECTNFPLPLTGYKILIVQSRTAKPDNHAAVTATAFKKLRHIYPHVTSFNDITSDMLDYARTKLKNPEIKYARHIISENERIILAKAVLKMCRIKDFAKLVNDSQKSIERLWGCEGEHTFLVNKICENPSCLCARKWRNGIFAIVEDGSEDGIINILRHDFNSRCGYFPHFCIADTGGTE